jgi:hypothetical protein
MAMVENKIDKAYEFLNEAEIACTLERNQGSPFKNPDIRTAKAFSWLLTQS